MRLHRAHGVFVLFLISLAAYGVEEADIILRNGKIITVDDRFTTAQAIAIKGERVMAVGSNAAIDALKGSATRVTELKGRTVTPGLIDNHAHFMRAAEYWHQEVRLDGVTSRKQALEMIAAKAKASAPGEWVLVLGGWSIEQFADERKGFTRDELDAVAPNNPVALQLIYFGIYTNTAGLKTLGIDANTSNPPGGIIVKDANGQPTGVLNGGGAVRATLAKLGDIAMARMAENARVMFSDLNRMGMTSYIDMGGRSFHPKYFEPVRTLADQHSLTMRVFYNIWLEPESPKDVDSVLDKIKGIRPFQGDDWFDNVGYGETVYFPLHDSTLVKTTQPSDENMTQWRRVAQAVADRGLSLNVHAQLRGSIERFVGEIEAINKVKPVRGLRWTLSHVDQLEPQDLERLRRLGLYVQLHSRPTIQGVLFHDVYDDKAYAMPPFRMVQDSGIPWGLGSDATAVTPSNPFYTLWFAVTGHMLGGFKVNQQTISREEALIAHTRNNAYFAFRESDIGSLQKGKYADLLVLDRDYLHVPADDIKNIKPLMTMVGGKVVYKAQDQTRSSRPKYANAKL